jgi:hypothetical protein
MFPLFQCCITISPLFDVLNGFEYGFNIKNKKKTSFIMNKRPKIIRFNFLIKINREIFC